MSRVKTTVSLPKEIVEYLRSKPNASAVISEAVAVYRVRELEEAYRSNAEEAEGLNREWEGADVQADQALRIQLGL